MRNNNVHAVIMAGGKGERFWPKSRATLPKQVLSLVGRHSLLYDTVARIRSIVSYDKILIVTNKEQSAIIRRQVPHIKRDNIIIEPVSRNTSACIGLAALFIEMRYSPESLMLVLPSDHLITKRKSFLSAISDGLDIARLGNKLVTIGIEPSYPATGYGYIEIGREPILNARGKKNVYKVQRFVEKPDRKRAEMFIRTKRHLWNSGMFIWKVSTILGEIEKHLPGLYDGLMEIKKRLWKDCREKSIDENTHQGMQTLSGIYNRLESVSIDYGVMEKSDNVHAIKADIGWHDLGSWASLNYIYKKDKDGNIIIGKHLGIDTKDCIVVSDKGNMIGTVGVRGLIIVRSGNSVLVSSVEAGERVKELVQGSSKRRDLRRFI